MHPLFQILTHSHTLFDIRHPSEYGPEVPCGFWIFRLLHRFCICSDSAPPCIWHSTYQTSTHRWNLQFCHLAGSGPANLLSYQGIPESDFLHHSIGPELYDCTRIPLAHPLQSLNSLGIGKHLFLATIATRIQELTFCRDTSIIGTSSEPSRLWPGTSRTSSTGNPMETP